MWTLAVGLSQAFFPVCRQGKDCRTGSRVVAVMGKFGGSGPGQGVFPYRVSPSCHRYLTTSVNSPCLYRRPLLLRVKLCGPKLQLPAQCLHTEGAQWSGTGPSPPCHVLPVRNTHTSVGQTTCRKKTVHQAGLGHESGARCVHCMA